MNITVKHINGSKEYPVVDKIPRNYELWGIDAGRNNEGYVLLCEKTYLPSGRITPTTFWTNLDTIQAIYVGKSDAEKLYDACHHDGIKSLDSARRAIKAASKWKATYYDKQRGKVAESVVGILARLY